eukprot:CAMPEP_0118950538 /NCGR_PEP_ID=MMETSP1169-20130426/51548_1 /TAXON_ID=36882 /ORGANISM="Pyramimonas obovata, Strain CCMP722" /LENGTH=241 /DNA_ID=CAMNT_0006897401 /DNA_START=52 /DNA_END=773 /DNA_ORIENTATION=-
MASNKAVRRQLPTLVVLVGLLIFLYCFIRPSQNAESSHHIPAFASHTETLDETSGTLSKSSLGSEWSSQLAACPGRVHFFFVSKCNGPSDWQAEGVVHSIFDSGMKGTVTRLVSCEDANYEYPTVWNPCYNIHVIPHNTENFQTGPALVDWVEHSIGSAIPDDHVVVEVNQDSILTRPLDELAQLVHAGKGLAQTLPSELRWFNINQDLIDASKCVRDCAVVAAANSWVGYPRLFAMVDWR